MSDKEKIQAAIDVLEALEGLPFELDAEIAIDSVKYWLYLELTYPYDDPSHGCISCERPREKGQSLNGWLSRFGHCVSCWMKLKQ